MNNLRDGMKKRSESGHGFTGELVGKIIFYNTRITEGLWWARGQYRIGLQGKAVERLNEEGKRDWGENIKSLEKEEK